MIRFYAFACALVTMCAITMQAQDQKTETGVKLSGVLFSRWEWNQSGAGATEKDANQFAIERMYLNARGPLSEDVNFRATLDVYSMSGSDYTLSTNTSTTTTNTTDSTQILKSTSSSTSSASLKNLNAMVQLKYAYFDWKAASWLTFRGGMQMTEWIDYVEGLWKYRGISKVLIDDRGINSSSDLGLSAIGKLPNKLGEVQVSVFNGSNFRNAEGNRFKDIAARVVITPLMDGGGDFKNLQVAAHYYTGNTALGVSRSRLGALVALPHDKFNVVLEYGSFSDNVTSSSSVKSGGLSVMAELKGNLVNEDLAKLSIIGRFDSYNPNNDLTDAQRTTTATSKVSKMIFGLSYKIASPITFVLDYQSNTYGSANVLKKYDGTLTDTDARIYGHFIVNL